MKGDVSRHCSSLQPEDLTKTGEVTEMLYDQCAVDMPFQSRHGKLQELAQVLKAEC